MPAAKRSIWDSFIYILCTVLDLGVLFILARSESPLTAVGVTPTNVDGFLCLPSPRVAFS